VYSIPTRHGFNRIGKKQSLAYIVLIAAARRRRFRSLKIRKQIGRHQIGIARLNSGAFPVHYNVVLNWSEIRSRDCQNYYHRFHDGRFHLCTPAQRLVPNEAVLHVPIIVFGRRGHIAVEHP